MLNEKRYTDEQLVQMIQSEKTSKRLKEKAKETLFNKYIGMLKNKTKKICENCSTDFDGTYQSLCYLFNLAIKTFKMKGQFKGYSSRYIDLKVMNDIGKQKTKLPYVGKESPFYIRNWDKVYFFEETSEVYNRE